jgi:S1-C subfamily serine protease
LKAGDVITSVNGERVLSGADLRRALRDVNEGGEARMGIVREKKESSVTAKLDDRPRRRASPEARLGR